MPVSSINIVEIALGLKNIATVERDLNKVEQQALKMATSIQRTYGELKDSVHSFVKDSGEQMESYRVNVLGPQTEASMREFKQWTDGVTDHITAQYNKVKNELNEDFLMPIQKLYGRASDAFHAHLDDVTETFGQWYEDATDTAIDAAKRLSNQVEIYVIDPVKEAMRKTKDFAIDIIVQTKDAVVEFVYNVAGPIIERVAEIAAPIINDVKQAIQLVGEIAAPVLNKIAELAAPLMDKVTKYSGLLKESLMGITIVEGAWLGGKAAVQAMALEILDLPNKFNAARDKIVAWKTAIEKQFNDVKIKIQAVGKIVYDIGDLMFSKGKDAVMFIANITGITAGLKAAGVAASWLDKKLGIMNKWNKIKDMFTGAFFPQDEMSSFFGIFSSSLEAILLPIEDIMYELSVDVVPHLINLILPLTEAMRKGVQWLKDSFNNIVVNSSAFRNIMTTVYTAVIGIADTVLVLLKNIITTLAPLVGTLVEVILVNVKKLIDLILPVISRLVESLLPLLGSAINGLMPIISNILDTITAVAGVLLGVIVDAITPIISSLQDAMPGIMDALSGVISAVLNLAKALLPVVTLLGKVIGFILKLAAPLFLKALTFTVNLVAGLINSVSWFITSTINGFGYMISALKSAWTGFKEFLGLSTIVDTVSGVFGAILKAVLSPIETIKGIINATVIDAMNSIIGWQPPLVGSSIGKLLGIDEIAKLAEGGIVLNPTIAQIGEAGPEIILPLKKETIQQIAPALFDYRPTTEIAQKLEMSKLETVHGERQTNLLMQAVLLLKELEIVAKTKKKELNKIETSPKLMFTTNGFV